MSAHPTNHDVSETERNTKLVCYLVTFLLGMLGNVLVLFILRKKNRRTANDVLIINLSVADVTLLFLSLPASILWFGQVPFPEFFCRFVVPCMTSTYNVSIFTMALMAVYRCYAILNSLKPEVRHRSLHRWVAATWVFGVLLLVPAMVVSEANSADGSCTEDWDDVWSRSYTATLFVLQYVLPLSTISIAYILIVIELQRSKRRHCSSNAQNRSAVEKRKKEDLQIVKMLATLVLLFAVCMLPIQTAWLLSQFGTESQRKIGVSLLKFADIVAYFQAFLNPIVYGTLTKYFRIEYVRLVKHLLCATCCISPRHISVPMVTHRSLCIPKEHVPRAGSQSANGNSIARVEGHGTAMMIQRRDVASPTNLETEL